MEEYKMTIDNFDKIRELLTFRSKDDFYFVQILQRKKDHVVGKVNGTNNNSRLIKAYYIDSLEHFDFVKPEIIEMCKIFNARAGMNLNRRSFEKLSLQHLKKITDQILNKDFNKSHRAYNTVCGAYTNESSKNWIIDIDDLNYDSTEMVDFINNKCEPEGDKYVTTIPSRSGYHLITRPFNLKTFTDKYSDIDVHKNNPTNIYIP